MSYLRSLREKVLRWYLLRSISKTEESLREFTAAKEDWRRILSTSGDGRLSNEDIDFLYAFWDISRVEKRLGRRTTPLERAALKSVLIENQSKESHRVFVGRTVRALATLMDGVTSNFFKPIWLPMLVFIASNLIDYVSAYMLFLSAPNLFMHFEGNRALITAFVTGNPSPMLPPLSLAYAAVTMSIIIGGKTRGSRLDFRFMPYLRYMAMCIIIFAAVFSIFGAISTLTVAFRYAM
jgi:hypothetical protein